MIFLRCLSVCILLLSTSSLYARENPVSSAICKNILEQKKPSAFLIHQGQLWGENKPIDLGDLESLPNKNEIPSTGESYLVIFPSKYSVSASASNSLNVDLAEVPGFCSKTKQYKIKWTVYPKNFGAGKFEEQFSLYFDGPGNNGYPPVISTMFNTSVTGFIHGPRTILSLDKDAANEFFTGSKRSLNISIKNTGDRNLNFRKLTFNSSENAKEIGLKHTNCLNREIEPMSSCLVELELQSRLSNQSVFMTYSFSFSSNEVGTRNTEIFLEHSGKSGVQAYIKRWE